MSRNIFNKFILAFGTLALVSCYSIDSKRNADIVKDVRSQVDQVQDSDKNDVQAQTIKDIFDAPATVSLYNEPLSKVLNLLVANVEYEDGIDVNQLVTVEANGRDVSTLLHDLLRPLGLRYVRKTNSIVVSPQEAVNFNVFGQPLSIVLRSIMGNRPYKLTDGAENKLSEPITIEFENTPLEIALDSLLSPIGLFWEKKDKQYRIFKEKEATFYLVFPSFEQDLTVSSNRVSNSVGGVGAVDSQGVRSAESGGISTSSSQSVSKINTNSVGEIEASFRRFLSETGRMIIHKESGTIWVRDSADIVDRVGVLVNNLNYRLTRSVNVSGVISEVTLKDGMQYGIDWTAVTNSLSLQYGAQSRSAGSGVFSFTNFATNATGNPINAYLTALEQFGDVRVVSRPSLSVTNGSIGSLVVGDTVSYVAQTFSNVSSSGASSSSTIVKGLQTGLSFYILPKVISDNEAIVYISPELTTLVGLKKETPTADTTIETPQLSSRQTQTVVKVRNGESIIISGMIKEEDNYTDEGVPVLKDVPIIGAAFSRVSVNKQTSEFAIMIQVNW